MSAPASEGMPVTPKGRFTLSNALTASRLVSAPFLYCAIVDGAWILACVLFWCAVATDWSDGRIARARGEATAFGGLLDHASDAIFVVVGLSALVHTARAHWLLPVLIVAAFLQYMLDSRALRGRPLRASELGRWNGVLYFVPIGIVVTREALALTFPGDGWVRLLGWLLVGSTLLSMSDRLWTRLGVSRERDD